jgi:hypothetical protein
MEQKHMSKYFEELSFNASPKDLPTFNLDGKDCGITTVRAHMAGKEAHRLMHKDLIANA